MITPDETGNRPNPESGTAEPAPLDDVEQTRKDVSYSPGSETETAAKQEDPLPDAVADDEEIDASRIKTVPGTGGPDDAGDVDLDPEDVGL